MGWIRQSKIETATNELQKIFIKKYSSQFLNNFNLKDTQVNNFLSDGEQDSETDILNSKTQQLHNMDFVEGEEEKDNLNEEAAA